MSPESVNGRPTRRHIHQPNGSTEEALCPYCGQSISRREFEEIRARIESEERARIAKVEQTLKDRFARERTQAETKTKAAVAQAKKDAAASAAAQIKAFRASQDATIAQRVQVAREAAAKKLAEAVNAEKAKAYEEKLKLNEQLQDVQRRLERKTADELGEGAEANLYEILADEFQKLGDRLERVARGRAGADTIHDIVHNGQVAGRIIYDSKNHARWQHKFTAKLRQDMIDHKADHGVLSSAVFPAGARQLHVQDGVIVAAPARVIVLAHVLRRQILQVHALRLGNEARDDKRDKLYAFITSDRCAQLLDRIGSLSGDVLELDAKEESTHRTVWKRRAELIKAIQGAHNEFQSEIEQVIGCAVLEQPS